MSRPTDDAKASFAEADTYIGRAGIRLAAVKPPAGEEARYQADLDLWRGLWLTNKGLIELSTGLRATYILLEDVRRQLSKKS